MPERASGAVMLKVFQRFLCSFADTVLFAGTVVLCNKSRIGIVEILYHQDSEIHYRLLDTGHRGKIADLT